MSIDRETARRIAALARIRVAEDRLPALAEELSQILGWVEQLQSVDVEGVEPMAAVNATAMPMREDAVSDGGIRDRVAANAPEMREGFFAVPKVVE